MAFNAKKTEHAGRKGAYWGLRVDAKRESRKARRSADKAAVKE